MSWLENIMKFNASMQENPNGRTFLKKALRFVFMGGFAVESFWRILIVNLFKRKVLLFMQKSLP